jgi:hypothetical protein
MAALFIIATLGNQLARHAPYVSCDWGARCPHNGATPHCLLHSPLAPLHRRSNLLAALKQLAAEGTSNQAKHATKALCASFEASPSRLIEAAQVRNATTLIPNHWLPFFP